MSASMGTQLPAQTARRVHRLEPALLGFAVLTWRLAVSLLGRRLID